MGGRGLDGQGCKNVRQAIEIAGIQFGCACIRLIMAFVCILYGSMYYGWVGELIEWVDMSKRCTYIPAVRASHAAYLSTQPARPSYLHFVWRPRIMHDDVCLRDFRVNRMAADRVHCSISATIQCRWPELNLYLFASRAICVRAKSWPGSQFGCCCMSRPQVPRGCWPNKPCLSYMTCAKWSSVSKNPSNDPSQRNESRSKYMCRQIGKYRAKRRFAVKPETHDTDETWPLYESIQKNIKMQ